MLHWKTLVVIAVLVVAGWLVTMIILSALARRPDNLGVKDGRLAACPATPNCVCSQASDKEHAIEPFTFQGDPEEAWAKLKKVLAGFPRTVVITETDDYLHTECRSLIFRFTDDVEFYLDRKASVIHVRSASRVGRSDVGVNRQRVEEIRKRFEAR